MLVDSVWCFCVVSGGGVDVELVFWSSSCGCVGREGQSRRSWPSLPHMPQDRFLRLVGCGLVLLVWFGRICVTTVAMPKFVEIVDDNTIFCCRSAHVEHI